MKKAILAIALILSTLLTYAQDFVVNVYQVDVLTYNSFKDEYESHKTYYPEGMQVMKRGNVFVISNQDESNYRLGMKLESKDPNCVNYIATDKDNEEIGLQFCLSTSTQTGTMTVLYLKKMAVTFYLKP